MDYEDGEIWKDQRHDQEVETAMQKIKLGKAVGVCGIEGELLKWGGEGMREG